MTIHDLERLARTCPGLMIPAGELVALVRDLVDATPAVAPPTAEPTSTWRERLWTVPPQTVMTVDDVAEAVWRSRTWVFARTRRDAAVRLPHSKVAGRLVFRAGALRAWLQTNMALVVAGPDDAEPDVIPMNRRGRR